MDAKMLCYQCQETSRGIGCEIMSVCGKNPFRVIAAHSSI